MSDTARRSRRFAGAASGVLLIALLITAGVFWVRGGRWYDVRTPSMGTAAPVGTLVLTWPTPVHDLAVGQVIAFRPPTERGETFTHRIVAIDAGRVTTRGDINGAPDAWQLTDADIVGRAVTVAPGLGWLLRGLPLLLIGWLVVWGITALWVRPAWRGPGRLVGAALVFLLAAVLLRPFVGIVTLTDTTDAAGVTSVSVVSTGVLPVRLAPTAGHGSGAALDLRYGHTGVIALTQPSARGAYDLSLHLHLHLLGWILAILACLSPLLLVLAFGFSPLLPMPVLRPTTRWEDCT